MATTTQVQALYIAYFGRPADPAGLKFWSNGTLSTEQELDGLADSMATSLEFKASIAGKTNRQVINQIYQNLFNRNADPAGLAFWLEALGEDPSTATAPNFQVLNQLGAPRTNIQDIGSNLVFAVQSKALAGKPDSDTVVLDSKVKGCQEFTDCVEDEGVTYAGTLPITKGKAFANAIVLPRDIPSGSETCVIVRNLNNPGYNPGGGDVTANGGGVKGNILTASRMADRINSTSGAQYEITNTNALALGKYLLDYNFAFDSFNQVINAVSSNDASTNTLNRQDSFIDPSNGDTDTLEITTSGANNVARATVTNIESITFSLENYTPSSGILLDGRITSTNGLFATGVNQILTTGSLDVGNTVIIDGTGSGASIINASGTVATHRSSERDRHRGNPGTTSSFTLTADAGGTALTGAAGDDLLIGGDGDDIMTGGGGADRFIVNGGADTILDFGVGGEFTDEILVNNGSVLVHVSSNYDGGSTDSVVNNMANTATVISVANGINFEAVQTDKGSGITINAAAGNSPSTLGGTNSPGGVDIINGNDGDNTIQGMDGNDILRGGAGADDIEGGDGADTITGNTGRDELNGNGGNDSFVFADNQDGVILAGNATNIAGVDIITDFVGNGAAVGDTINLGGGAAAFGTGITFTNATNAVVAAVAVNSAAGQGITNWTGITAAAEAAATGTASSSTTARIYDVTLTGDATPGDFNAGVAGRFLIINDNTAAIGASDAVINITGITGALNAADFTFA